MLLFPFSVDSKVLLRAEPDGVNRRWKLLQLNLCNVFQRCFIRQQEAKEKPERERTQMCKPTRDRRAHPKPRDYDCWDDQVGENKLKQPWRAGVDEIMRPSNVQLK